MTITDSLYEDIFSATDDEFHRGFMAGVLWSNLRENHDRAYWDPENADVEICVRMGEALGYRVEVKDSLLSGHRHLTFTSTFGG